ncbi:YGGT family protein [Desulfitobacterium sp. LBE]|uniref:YggT family protein n=6 Tax=root TaxID=1 RepID=Q24XB0_DESHY|nr:MULTISPECIES: YggT family protein [Desulfitobacterium]ACL20701.1 conserved hypothetical protein [Desulfitobacterium hafniense DCB-2]EHL07266.1 hypothetical protein HMPREF0322_02025 [Desulfitobacterium hafniense DP7]KTE90983.1 hypothetical protein AT727_05130 [Desulfitobacterium hafniense]MEA5024823.1 YggT family protein [Desulfitobacterium hafniense]TWH56471.1 YGGT family protein [Desulfitobacterium sp. LBE]
MDHSEEIRSWQRVVYYILGVIEVLLAFRLIFKLLGANPVSGFVSAIYSLTNLLMSPFLGIFRTASARGVETQAVLEPATLVAMIVYAVIAWGIAKLIEIMKRPKKV